MTGSASLALLPHRGAIRVAGPDAAIFLQGLISNDIRKVTDETGVYAALLTPQGKFLHDLFVLGDGPDAYLVDCERDRADDLIRRLNGYRLRAKVTCEDVCANWDIAAAWGDQPVVPAGRLFADPRLPALGWRVFMPAGASLPLTTTSADYDLLRFGLGVPDGSRDLEVEKSTLAEGNIDHLNGIDWKKGCYVGQELTARMHYRGLAKKRMFPVRIDGQLTGETALFSGAQEVGSLRGHTDTAGIAVINLEAMANPTGPFYAGDTVVTATWPDWLPRIESK